MNIIITEEQYKLLLENDQELNNKPSRDFDEIYGTNLSQTYDFGNNLTSDDVWNIWLDCRDNDNCVGIGNLILDLPKTFPYYDVKKLSQRQRLEIVLGMASEYNPSDIVSFAVHQVTYEHNVEQKRLEKQLPEEINDNIRWVLSPDTIEQIRNRFGIYEI
jgi:hypothetical protein